MFTFVVAEITLKVAVINSSVDKITFVVAKLTCGHFFSGQDQFCSGGYNF